MHYQTFQARVRLSSEISQPLLRIASSQLLDLMDNQLEVEQVAHQELEEGFQELEEPQAPQEW